ncbi:MAG: sulfatase-like hydrolase/transferase [Hespellia sp.]|nr:sulfatase-like hydrolase/transferase [Hespellia sp.]
MKTFLKQHWKYLLQTLLLSLLSTLLLCIPLITPCREDYGELYFSYTLVCAFWTGVFLLCALYPLFLWIGRYGIFHGFLREKKFKSLKLCFPMLLRLAIGLFAAYEILMYQHYRFRFAILSIFRNEAGAYVKFCLAVICIALLLTDFSRAFPAFSRWNVDYPWMLKTVVVLLVSFVCFFIIEMFCESKMLTYMDMRFLNMLYWTVLLAILFLIFRRLKISAVITLVIAYVLGFANYLVVMFRGSEILWGDITAWGTAMEVVDNYKFSPDHYFATVTAVFVLTILVILALPIREEKQLLTKKRVLQTVLAEAAIIALLVIANISGALYGFIQGNFWDYTIMMGRTGYLPYLISNINYSTRVTLEDYSASDAQKVLEGSSALLKEEENDEDSGITASSSNAAQAPNIIMIMDEAFSDLAVNGTLETNQDYMPFVHSMSENTVKGALHLSICGSPTANTEFEVLSRSSLAFMPTGCIPYNQYITTKIPSLASVLKSSDSQYQTYAYHSYSATGYNRPVVYDNFGFDESLFVEEEDMDEYDDTIRDYISDSDDFKKVEEIFEEKKSGNPLFLFNVTMQNHGGYTTVFNEGEDKIEVTNFDANYQLETYLSLIKKSDNAISELIAYFEKEDEPVMIILYGDHQPKLPDEALEPLMGNEGGTEDTGDGTSRYSDVASRYEVPFFIWTNYDVDEVSDLDISTNYLSSYILEHAGIPLTAYDEFLLELRDSYPVITAKEYWDADGTVHHWDEETPSVLKSYENIQYNCLFDTDNKLTEFFNGVD